MSGQTFLSEWPKVWAGCARRIRRWRLPPRWSARDWWEEMEALGVAAAWHALGDYDPTRGCPLHAFLRQRVLSSALTRYRQEWAYARNCGPGLAAESPTSRTDGAPSAARAFEAIQDPLARLSELDRWLIEHLFWGGWSEADVAGVLGISQQAVSKRKHRILLVLRRSAGSAGPHGEESWF